MPADAFDANLLLLAPEEDIRTAARLKELLLAGLEKQTPLNVAAHEVVRITTPALQLLLAALRQPGAIRITSPNDACVTAWGEIGLSDEFMPSVQRAAGAV